MKQKKHHEEIAEENEGWLISFSDMMSLLMAFFILLFSMSTMDQRKFYEMGKAISSSFSSSEVNEEASSAADAGAVSREMRAFQMLVAILNLGTEQQALNKVEELYSKKVNAETSQNLAGTGIKEIKDLNAQLLKEDITKPDLVFEVILPSQKIFANSGAELREDAKPSLTRLSRILEQNLDRIEIEVIVHTSSPPPPSGSPFADNWDRSTQQALSVARFLAGAGIPGKYLTVKGMGSMNPILPEMDSKGRPVQANMQQNERIHIAVRRANYDS